MSRRKECAEATEGSTTRESGGGGVTVRSGRKSDKVPPFRKHDALFRQIISNPERARALLQDHLPPECVRWLDLDRVPEQVEGSAIDGTGRATQADAVFRIRLQTDAEKWAFVVLEHKSYVDARTSLQLVRYMARIWLAAIDEGNLPGGKLPLVIPVVIFHGKGNWTTARSTEDIVETGPQGREHFVCPSGNYILVDLKAVSPEQWSRDPATRAGIAALALAGGVALSEETADMLVAGLVDTEFGHYLLNYTVWHLNVTQDDLNAAIQRQSTDSRDRTQRKELVMTIAETLHEEGRAEGRVEGKVETLLRLARLKFGAIPRSLATRLRGATNEDLDRWLDALITADDLEAVFGSPPRRRSS